MSGWFLYWLLKLDSLRDFVESMAFVFVLIGALGTIALVLCRVIGKGIVDGGDETGEIAVKIGKRLWPFAYIVFPMGLVLQLTYTMAPSTKDAAIIYVVPKVANSEMVQEIPKKLLTLSNEWLEELRPEKIKESAKTINNKSQAEKESD